MFRTGSGGQVGPRWAFQLYEAVEGIRLMILHGTNNRDEYY